MFSKNKNSSVSYGIIGTNRFGQILAEELAKKKVDLLVAGRDGEVIRNLRTMTENALIVRDYSKKALSDAGFSNCDVVIVSIDQMTESILTTLTLSNMKIPKIIAMATTTDHGEILSRLGAEVVYPERDMAIRLASRLQSDILLDFVQLNEVINIFKIKVVPPLTGLTVMQSGIRQKFDMNILAVSRDGKVNQSIRPDLVFKDGDILFLAGRREGLEKLHKWMENK